MVIYRDLFARLNVSQREEQDVIADDLHERVWDARVIYVMSAVTSAASIKTPATIDFADTQHLSMRATTCFAVGDLLAGVLGNLVSSFKGKGGEAAFSVYRRRFDS